MNKLLSALTIAALATIGMQAHAADAPAAKASEAAPAASSAKAEKKAAHKAKHAAKKASGTEEKK